MVALEQIHAVHSIVGAIQEIPVYLKLLLARTNVQTVLGSLIQQSVLA
jgi:hypothetical protein